MSAWFVNVRRVNTVTSPAVSPPSAPNSKELPQNPRLLSGAYSAMKVAAPPYSPPVESQCLGPGVIEVRDNRS